jgi:3-isopropylmalate/(R)-2-methylmalate dehydratase large subunit
VAEKGSDVDLKIDGRVLFLSQDAGAMRRQLAGQDLALAEALPLRDNVSTDEITPAWVCYHFDEKLGDYPYLGLTCGAATPVEKGSVKHGGFAVTVAGQRYGKGSSREASPYAERLAGIRLVIAHSFERIYRQNCHNLGLLTSTDFGLIERIRRGEAIPIEEFTRGEDPISAEIIRRGGLFELTRARLRGETVASAPAGPRPMTYAEKILSRARAGARRALRPGDALFARADWRYAHEYVAPMAIRFLEQAMGKDITLRDPDSIVCFADHLTFIHRSMSAERRAIGLLDAAQAMAACQQAFCDKHGLQLHGDLPDREGAEGISHSIMAERYVLPGQLVVGTDSHTPHCGALGALAFGIGASDMASAWITGDVRVTVPPTCRVRLNGRLADGVEAKDVVLHLLRLPYVREGRAIGQVIEYSGEALLGMTTDDRATLTNMVAEIGGFAGIVTPDGETLRFLLERRALATALDPWMRSDPDAHFAHTIEVDCSALEPMLAQPGDPGNGIEVSRLQAPVPIDIAYGGSCTGGKREDLRRYHEVLRWALEHGLGIAPGTRFYLQFGSQDVREHCVAENMMDVFGKAGVELVEPGCGACINAGPGISERPDQVTVSAVNRNFPGRSGPGRVWLASPSTVAASAVAGRLVSFGQLRELHADA